MSTNPNQGQNPDQSAPYGGYTGYTPPSQQSNYQYGQQPQQDYQYGQQQDYQYGQQQQQSYQYGQQQNAYQPPSSASARSQSGSDAYAPTSMGMDAKREALFSYLIGPFTGLFFLIMEKKNRFVRFHAAQSFVLFGALTIVYLVLYLIGAIPLVGGILAPILGCLTWIVLGGGGLLWIFLMLRSYRGATFRVPYVSRYADSLLTRVFKQKTV